MPKYIRRTKTSQNRSADSVRDVLLKELEREGQRLLKQLATQFTRDLEKESGRVLQGLLPGGSSKQAGGNAIPGLESAAALIGSLVNYAVTKPKTTTDTRESTRSRDAELRFRTSQSQAMAQATAELARSERNT